MTEKLQGLLITAGVYVLAFLAAWGSVSIFDGLNLHWAVLIADSIATVVVFSGSLIFDNSSIYDPYWSVAPIPIVLFLFFISPMETGTFRGILVILFILIWGVRLTVNWIARWEGLMDEDWRYVEIRERSGNFYWPASFGTIHFFPTLLVFVACLPLFTVFGGAETAFSLFDVLGILFCSMGIFFELFADIELQDFLGNHERKETLDTGLWSLCRHPNYFGEVSFWWGIFFFGLGASLSAWWTIIGTLSITALFLFASVPWKERHMSARHPAYADYQKRVPLFIPNFLKLFEKEGG